MERITKLLKLIGELVLAVLAIAVTLTVFVVLAVLLSEFVVVQDCLQLGTQLICKQ